MANRKSRMPIIGEAFDSDQMNERERVDAYVHELEHYRPRGFAALAREGRAIAAAMESDETGDAIDSWESWLDACDELLTAWARRKLRHDYVYFGTVESWGSVGFFYQVDSALEDVDLRLDAGDSVPRGFSGMAAFVTDRGNVTVQTFSRGRMCRELFAVV